LGYGQGHFDRYLHQHPTLTIGIGYKGQEIEEIPNQSHDFALDYILTEQGVVSCQGKDKAKAHPFLSYS
jgi:5-formyltetrahydrofolate cyclo-ligase